MKTGKEIITQAGIVLQDVVYDRWPVTELVRWINDAQRAIVLAKPSAKAESVILDLAEGTLQTLTDGSHLTLLRIPRNIKSVGPPRIGGRAIRATTRDLLDASSPDWHDRNCVRYTAEVRQYVFDEQSPREFYVYPGNDGSGQVEAIVGILPDMLVASGPPDDVNSYDASIGLPEPYGPVILDYVLYRALSKDDIAGDPGRSQLHYRAFAEALGIKVQVEGASSPNARARITK